MEPYLAHFVPFLNEIAIYAAIEILISLLLEEPISFYLEIIFNPIFTKPQIYSYEGFVCTIYATAFCCICQFLKAFSAVPMKEAGDYQMAALYWHPITKFEITKNSMDEDWDYIAPLFATIHHIYIGFVCCFIGLSMVCGLMIHGHLPSLEIPYLEWCRSAYAFIATICSGTFRINRYIYAAGEPLLERCLDWLLADSPLWLIAGSTGLILGDILLAMWVANLLIPSRPSEQFNSNETWDGLSRMPHHGPVLTWHFGDPSVPGYGSKVVDLIRSYLADIQSYPARFAVWYNNQHELDEMHHYPALTGPIALLIIFFGFKLIWGRKPQQLRQVEYTIEETLRKNAITYDFEDYLRKQSSRMDGCKAFLATNLKVIRGIVARNRTLMNQFSLVNARAERVEKNLTGRAQQLDEYMRECLDLRGVNTYLQTELGRLRISADVQVHTASMEVLNAQLASANNENVNLQQQRNQLQQELEASRGSRATAEARATAAERARRIAVTETSTLREQAERLEQQNAELQQDFQEMSEQQSALERERVAAEAAANNNTTLITELRTRNNAMVAHIQSLQARLDSQEARSAETTRAAEDSVRALQAELAALKRDQDSRTKEFEDLRAREEQTKSVLRNRDIQMRKVHRIRQKKSANLKVLWQEERRTAKTYKHHNQLLEHRLARLDASQQGSTQVIHDPQKDNEARKLRDQLAQSQARNRLLQNEVRNLQETTDRLQRQLVTAATMSRGQQSATPSTPTAAPSPSTTRSHAESEEVVRLRTELTRSEQENQRLRIQLSNSQMQRGGSKLGSPFMRGGRR